MLRVPKCSKQHSRQAGKRRRMQSRRVCATCLQHQGQRRQPWDALRQCPCPEASRFFRLGRRRRLLVPGHAVPHPQRDTGLAHGAGGAARLPAGGRRARRAGVKWQAGTIQCQGRAARKDGCSEAANRRHSQRARRSRATGTSRCPTVSGPTTSPCRKPRRQGLTHSTVAATAAGSLYERRGRRAAPWPHRRGRRRRPPPQPRPAPSSQQGHVLAAAAPCQLQAVRTPRRRQPLRQACHPSRWRTARPCGPPQRRSLQEGGRQPQGQGAVLDLGGGIEARW